MTVATPTPTPTRTAAGTELRLDRFVDAGDASIAEHLLVDAPAPVVFAAARALDLLEVRTPLLTASFWARGLPAKVLGRPEPPPPAALTLEGELGLPGWMLLDEVQDREIVFGAIGVFWTPTITWNTDVTPAEFASFAEPGWGRIACNYTTLPYGAHRTLLTYECRTQTTDTDSRQRFLRYWWLIRPFVAHIMRATLATIATHATTDAGGTR